MFGWLSSSALFAQLLAASLAQPTAPVEPQHIYGGDEVDSCGWPSVVYLSSGSGACTGTLIHPQVVLTAAHCVADGVPSTVRFGENAQTAQQLVGTQTCRQGPGWIGATNQGQDYAYCLLEAPVTSVPIIPVVSGCEASAVYPGARIAHVGFGRDENGESGRKKMLELTITNVTPQGELLSGTPNQIICNGDSGGPTFVYLDPAQGGDGSWRVAAIHSWAQGADPVEPNCTGTAGSVLATQAIAWIEQDSGIDITPCADGDIWSPTAHCSGLPVTPWLGEGTYTTECTTPQVVPWGATCGPGLDATPDATPPLVTIVTPTLEQEFEAGTASVEVLVEAVDEGWGVDSVSMAIRALDSGSEQLDVRNEWQAWSWDLTLPDGAYEVRITATDHAGNASEEQIVCFGVGGPGCPDASDTQGEDASSGGLSGGTGGTGDEDGDGDGSTTGATGEAQSGGSSGSPGADGGGGDGGCRVGGEPGGVGFLLLTLGLLRRRRAGLSR